MKKNYKIFETIHDKQKYYLVFSPDNEVVYKTSKEQNAIDYIKSKR